MAAILPTLLLLLLGIGEFARAWLTLEVVTLAAREAVRAAVVAAPNQVQAAGLARINQILSPGTWTGNVTCSATPCVPNALVQANVAVTFQTVVPLILPMLQSVQIQQSASMRYE